MEVTTNPHTLAAARRLIVLGLLPWNHRLKRARSTSRQALAIRGAMMHLMLAAAKPMRARAWQRAM
jgi:hypothetical protein